MDKTNYSTGNRKSQHLNREERHYIEVRHNYDGWSIYRIAKSMGRAYNTIKDELARGSVADENGENVRYSADKGEEVYYNNRKACTRTYRAGDTMEFLHYVEEKFHDKNTRWSLDACVGEALRSGEFRREEIVCTKTLYNYVELGILKIKNIDLPEKISRNTKTRKVRENKRNLGKSIEERPEEVETRTEFGHWEIDSVLGKKQEGEPVVLTLVERMTRYAIWLKIENHTAEAVRKAMEKVFSWFSDKASQVFKTITADNGSEFAELSTLETDERKVYFTHPFSSFEKGTNECHNRMLRRFVPKGRSFSGYSAEDILHFGDVINGLPRKILGYHTPEQCFDALLDMVYSI